MKATFNAVAEILGTSADAYIAYTKAIASRMAGVMTKVTPALEEILEAVEGSNLPAAVKRLKGLDAEAQAAIAEYLPAILEATGPMSEAAERLSKRWAELTKTDAEEAREAADLAIDADEALLQELETVAEDLPFEAQVAQDVRNLARGLRKELRHRPLTDIEKSCVADLRAAVETVKADMARREAHRVVVNDLARALDDGGLRTRDWLEFSPKVRHFRAIVYGSPFSVTESRALTDAELEQLGALRTELEAALTASTSSEHAISDERVAMHRKY